VALRPVGAVSKKDGTAAMHLRLSDPASIPELRHHFERSGFVTDRVTTDTIAIRAPSAPTQATTADAIELHLGVWRAMHPEVEIELSEAR
jgi:hypothetical protein